jgi:hypothetical protein
MRLSHLVIIIILVIILPNGDRGSIPYHESSVPSCKSSNAYPCTMTFNIGRPPR